jgi:hypothetical protein
MLGTVHDLNLEYCVGVKDFSMLRNVHTLNLKGCKNLKDFIMQ